MPDKKKLTTEDILLSAFVGVESAHAFSAFNPSIFTIQSLAVPQGNVNQIRVGYVPSVIFSLALGGIVGAIRKTWLPLVFGLGTSAFMVGVYEAAIRTAPAPTASQSAQNLRNSVPQNQAHTEVRKARYTVVNKGYTVMSG